MKLSAGRKVLGIAIGFGILILVGRAMILRTGELPTEAGSSATAPPSPTDALWGDLFDRTPVPQTAPLPPSDVTSLDGSYAKFDPTWPQWWLCLRCADYRPAGGIWKLNLDRGVLRIVYDVTGWRTLASFRLESDGLSIFNDPVCPEVTGEYRWVREESGLRLTVVRDECAFGLRAQNLAAQRWLACQPHDEQATAVGRAIASPGCGSAAPVLPTVGGEGLPWQVSVSPGDARKFDSPPDITAVANSEDRSPPEAIRIAFSQGSIGYGSNRILWRDTDWIEASTELPVDAMGVQFLGAYVIGWARVRFDGVEVWIGDTVRIWSSGALHGGYVQVSGLEPGPHTIRVERLAVDGRPVEVLFFGFGSAGE